MKKRYLKSSKQKNLNILLVYFLIFKTLLTFFGIFSMAYLATPKKVDAQILFESFIQGTDTVNVSVNLWISKIKGHINSIGAPPQWNLQLSDTYEFYVKNGQKWRNVTGSHLFIPLYLDSLTNYTITLSSGGK